MSPPRSSSGAQGYVLKTRYLLEPDQRHRPRARRTTLRSVPHFSIAAAGSGHTVQFHMNDRFFLDEVSRFIGATLQSGEPIVVAVTDETRTGIAQRLKDARDGP